MDCSHTIDNVYIQKIIQFTQNLNSYGLMVLRKSIETKKIDNKFNIYWYDRLLVIDKKVMSMVNLNKNQYKFATSIDIKNVVNFFFFLCVCIISSMIFNSTIQFIQIYIAASSSFYSSYRISKNFDTYSKLVRDFEAESSKSPNPSPSQPKHTKPSLSQKKKSTTVSYWLSRCPYKVVIYLFIYLYIYIYIYIYKYKTAYKVVEASSSTPFFLYGIKIQREKEIRNSEIRTTSLQIHHRLRTKKQCLRVHHSAAMKRHRSSASSAQPQHLFSLVNFLFNPN